MDSNTKYFYRDLPFIANEEELFRDDSYHKIPPDWLAIIADIKDSSQAIDEGQYKNINVISVAAIIGAKNACSDLDIPYIFGGDGAHIFIPPEKEDATKEALSLTKMRAIEEFNLELRISFIPMKTINENGGDIYLAKLQLSPSAFIAMSKGNGIEIAEHLTRTTEQFEIPMQRSTNYNAYEGFECKWDSIQSKRGEILTLIIQSADHQLSIFSKVFSEIEKIAPHVSFVNHDKMNIKYSAKNFFKEVQMKYGGIKKYPYFFFGLLNIYYEAIFKNRNKSFFVLDHLNKNTDHFKIDDNLKMIMDITLDQKNRILQLLNKMRNEGLLFYGYHSNKEALLTCYVKSHSDHIHFVDGGQGGYTIASKYLKDQRNIVHEISKTA